MAVEPRLARRRPASFGVARSEAGESETSSRLRGPASTPTDRAKSAAESSFQA
jgi:hypothetical protein